LRQPVCREYVGQHVPVADSPRALRAAGESPSAPRRRSRPLHREPWRPCPFPLGSVRGEDARSPQRRTPARSTPKVRSTATATSSFARTRASSMCSVPTYSWPSRAASSRVIASTFRTPTSKLYPFIVPLPHGGVGLELCSPSSSQNSNAGSTGHGGQCPRLGSGGCGEAAACWRAKGPHARLGIALIRETPGPGDAVPAGWRADPPRARQLAIAGGRP
jgi:hypothetical protein